MPGSTAPGTPYALPEDPLVQWPATSQAVAARIDAVAEQFNARKVPHHRMVSGVFDTEGRAHLGWQSQGALPSTEYTVLVGLLDNGIPGSVVPTLEPNSKATDGCYVIGPPNVYFTALIVHP